MRIRQAVRCIVVRSRMVPDLLSLRLEAEKDANDANDLRRALTANFKEGDVVIITPAPKLR